MELDGLLQPLGHHAAQTLVWTLCHELRNTESHFSTRHLMMGGQNILLEATQFLLCVGMEIFCAVESRKKGIWLKYDKTANNFLSSKEDTHFLKF